MRVRLFSLYRDAVGKPEIDINIEGSRTVSSIIRELAEMYPKLRKAIEAVPPLILVNGITVGEDSVVDNDSEIALAPPASGGGSGIEVGLFDRDVSLDEVVLKAVGDRGVGAIAIFVGVVKGEVDGHSVQELVYEAYTPYALRALEKIALEEKERYGLYSVQILHRVGVAKPGEKTLVIAVAARGRKEALSVLSAILERVKSEPPIYKLEKRDDGEYWVVGDSRRIPRSILG